MTVSPTAIAAGLAVVGGWRAEQHAVLLGRGSDERPERAGLGMGVKVTGLAQKF